jgi:hypothetical protein
VHQRRRLALVTLLASLALLAAQAVPASAAAKVSFGAKFTSDQNAPTGTDHCSDNANVGNNCTWLMSEAYHNVGHERAPKTGTIGQVRLISCVPGSFVLQLAQYNPSSHKAKDDRNSTKITYQADPSASSSDGCGGASGHTFQIQSIPVTVAVTKGEYIAFKAPQFGPIYCSGGSGVELYSPPLVPGSGFNSEKGNTGCLILVQLVYK